MSDNYDEDDMMDPTMPVQSGGNNNDKSFVEYMTSFSATEKGQVMNLVQYCGIAVVPLLALLKIMKMYMPISNPLKPTSELVFEVIVQLLVILVAFFFIHKIVLYFPTYSQINYDGFSLLSGMLPLLFLMFTLDTKISEKLNVLFDRLLAMLGLIKEPYEVKEEPDNESQMMPSIREPMQPTMREPMQTTSIEELSGMNNMGGGSTYESFEPMPANMFN